MWSSAVVAVKAAPWGYECKQDMCSKVLVNRSRSECRGMSVRINISALFDLRKLLQESHLLNTNNWKTSSQQEGNKMADRWWNRLLFRFRLFHFYAFVSVIALARGIMFSRCPSVPFLWMRYLRNALRKFLPIWHKRPLGLEDELW